jgi:hypothetical protein
MACDVRPAILAERSRDAIALFRAVLDQQRSAGL